jgi:hypothetical protein
LVVKYKHVFDREAPMAKNTGKGYREGEVRQRSQIHNPLTDEWVKRNTKTGRFVEVNKSGEPFKGVRREHPQKEG